MSGRSGVEPTTVPRCTGSVRGVVVVVALLLTSCTARSIGDTTPDTAPSGSSMVQTDVDGTPHPIPATACPVTLPKGQNPPGHGLTSRLSHGNGRLWVELYPRGIIRPAYYGRARPNGAIVIKFPWTRGVP